MIYEIVFWGGPKDGHKERQTVVPADELYCLDHSSPLLDQQMVDSEMKKDPVCTVKYSIYLAKQITKRKYQYTFSGFL